METPLSARTLYVYLSVVAGMASILATSVHAQDRAGRVVSGDLGIHYAVHKDLNSGGTPFVVLHGGIGSIAGDFSDLLPFPADRSAVIGIEQQGHGTPAAVTRRSPSRRCVRTPSPSLTN